MTGVTGKKALDYTENNPEKVVLKFALSKKDIESATISMWVRFSLKLKMEYVIVSFLKKGKNRYEGCKVPVQSFGAWKFSVNKGGDLSI